MYYEMQDRLDMERATDEARFEHWQNAMDAMPDYDEDGNEITEDDDAD
jgi:hypothetical protein